ncbi:hypothetical protein K435DRAFT_864183 [Dendrothele bispora CBS 962.96]|uniref:Uncharacterized protein n=1 Tax=Dendrothele bispora (strain CBS 962.96) TaxID=1314807 RepID=A0A4S8LMK3_DENBC|nr:hypothetical protein K435DRAFT_864183 [Dendrothele bispora CBS 962.96]
MSVLPSNHSLQFPTEILERIIQEHWALILTTRERVSFMRNSMLVNSTWMSLYMRASCTDIHIPSFRYVLKLINIIQRNSVIYNKFAPGLHDNLCRSITFRRDYESGPIDTSMYTIIQFLSKTIQGINRLPHLRRFSFELVDQTLNAIFPIGNIIPFHFPSNITTLEVLFHYSPSILFCPESMKQTLLNVEPSGLFIGSLPFIRTLRVHGANAGSMRDLVRACIHLRVYDSDVSSEELPKRLRLGMQLQRERQARVAAQAALEEEIKMRIEMQRLVDEGREEEVLEAVGAYRVDDVPRVLIDLQSELASMLEKERMGDVDVLARRFLQLGIRVCEKVVRILNRAGVASDVGSSPSFLEIEEEEEIQPRPVTYDIEISPLTKTKPNTSSSNVIVNESNNDSRRVVNDSSRSNSTAAATASTTSSSRTRSHVNNNNSDSSRTRSHVNIDYALPHHSHVSTSSNGRRRSRNSKSFSKANNNNNMNAPRLGPLDHFQTQTVQKDTSETWTGATVRTEENVLSLPPPSSSSSLERMFLERSIAVLKRAFENENGSERGRGESDSNSEDSGYASGSGSSADVHSESDDDSEGYTTAEEGHSFIASELYDEHDNEDGLNVGKQPVSVLSAVDSDSANATSTSMSKKSWWIRKTANKVMSRVDEIRADIKSKKSKLTAKSKERSC